MGPQGARLANPSHPSRTQPPAAGTDTLASPLTRAEAVVCIMLGVGVTSKNEFEENRKAARACHRTGSPLAAGRNFGFFFLGSCSQKASLPHHLPTTSRGVGQSHPTGIKWLPALQGSRQGGVTPSRRRPGARSPSMRAQRMQRTLPSELLLPPHWQLPAGGLPQALAGAGPPFALWELGEGMLRKPGGAGKERRGSTENTASSQEGEKVFPEELPGGGGDAATWTLEPRGVGKEITFWEA